MTTLDHLEAELRRALDDGDASEAERLSREVDHLDHAPGGASILSAALWYASQGLRVFALSPGSKIPHAGTNGCLDATNDEATIRAWWDCWPNSNVGIATGHLVDVVDVDGPIGQASRAEHWDDVFATIDADNVGKVLTPRPGGMHIYVPAQPGETNGANIVPGVDYRAAGGYVVAPPSVNGQGAYKWLGTPDFGAFA